MTAQDLFTLMLRLLATITELALRGWTTDSGDVMVECVRPYALTSTHNTSPGTVPRTCMRMPCPWERRSQSSTLVRQTFRRTCPRRAGFQEPVGACLVPGKWVRKQCPR
jgi:hypothetical protein